MKILIVDDEPLNLKIIEKYLKEFKYNVHTAQDGLEALEILTHDQEGFHIVLTDRMMPRMDGIELTRKIKHDDKTKDIPVIMITAAAESHHIIEGKAAGVYYYITKPFEKETLFSVIDSAVQEINKRPSA